MLQFKERKRIVDTYRKFLEESNSLKNNELTFLNFLYVEGLINDSACENYINKIYRIKGEEDENH